MGTGLSGLASLLAEVAIRLPGQHARLPLPMSYQAALSEPIIGAGQAPDGVVLPALGEAYVDPVCRVAETGPGDRPSEPEWWEERRLVPDVDAFLAGYLTSRRAVALPLVVLGEPGSGKSKLAEVLVARLPEHDFLPILVPLRDVAAESMIAEQIEQAIAQGPGKQTGWHDLLEAAAGALPVVVLDGLDELIQATAVNRYDYLEQVRDFQRQQSQIGRPVAVIVTSRTIVADLVRFPRGSVALQLQPFTDDQVRRWLQIWGRHNSAVLAARGLRPLTVEAALAHRELAGQPLLLLLVAIFDAAQNALQREGTSLSQAGLYERLLTEFAQREIAKTAAHRALPADRQRQLTSREVQRLAVVALAMFARGQQAASEAELNQDLPVLFPQDEGSRDDAGRTLTPAQRATGRFFFIHKSEAHLGNDRARSYEFLHATFGEFLVARLVVSALRDAAARREAALHSITAAGPLDDGFLYAALSFSCLVSRTSIVNFTAELLRQLPDDERARCREALGDLIRRSLFPGPSRSFQHYEPVRCPISRRIACYSANMVVMLVLLAGNVSVSELCGPTDTGKNWAEIGYLWRSAFSSSEWRGLIDTVRARVSRSDGPVEIELSREDGAPVSPVDSIIIVTDVPDKMTNFDAQLSTRPGVTYGAEIPASGMAGRVFRDLAFAPSWHTAMLLLQTVPYLNAAGGEIRYQLDDGTLTLPGHLLALLDHTRGASPEARYRLYDAHAAAIAVTPELAAQLSDRLRQDLPDFPVSWTVLILQKMAKAPPTRAYVTAINALWRRVDSADERELVLTVAARLRASWPDELLAILDSKLRHPTDELHLTD